MPTEHVRAMVDALPLDEPEEGAGPAAIAWRLRALRDRAIILVGYAGAFHRAESARIRWEDVTLNADGMEIFVLKAKTDQWTVGFNFARTAEFCPVCSLRGWTSAGHANPMTTAGYVEDAKHMETKSRDLGL